MRVVLCHSPKQNRALLVSDGLLKLAQCLPASAKKASSRLTVSKRLPGDLMPGANDAELSPGESLSPQGFCSGIALNEAGANIYTKSLRRERERKMNRSSEREGETDRARWREKKKHEYCALGSHTAYEEQKSI